MSRVSRHDLRLSTLSGERQSLVERPMLSLKRAVKIGANAILSVFGCEIRKTPKVENARDRRADGFPVYVEESAKVGIDVNDWQEQVLGWPKALPILEQTVFKYIRADSIVCNLGVGTGRWARHISAKLPKGELHLVDHSPWLVKFLTEYFRANPHVRIHLNDGYALPWHEPSVDLIFSGGTFIALKLGHIYLYAQQFFEVLRSGGYCVIEYIDVTTPGGWNWLETQSNRVFADCYTYYTPEVVDKVFSSAGFDVVNRYESCGRTFLVCKKP
jgi:ubiquinone/menaquinone biosynthesis C-methylase UbiE